MPKLLEDEGMFDEDRYTNSQDVSMRLDGSLVTYNGKIYYATADDSKLLLYRMKGGDFLKRGTVSANDKRVDVSSIEIGNVYIPRSFKTVYVSRVPYRKQKQGSSETNNVFCIIGTDSWQSFGGGYPFITESLFEALDGRYQMLEDLQKIPGCSVPISKHFSIYFGGDQKTYVYYETSCIGELKNDKYVKLFPEYKDSLMIMRLANVGLGEY